MMLRPAKKRSGYRAFQKRSGYRALQKRSGYGAFLLFAIVHLLIFGADWLAPVEPHVQDRTAASSPPSLERSEAGYLHPLGTDRFGRDLLSRLLHGARLSIIAGWMAAGLAILLGTALGALAGYRGGFIDVLLMRLSELTLSLPWLYLLLGVRAMLPLETPPQTTLLILVALIGLLAWAGPARLVRGVTAAARHADFVTAARGFGTSEWHILRRHVLPQTFSIALTQLALLIPACIVAEVMLSFFGLGAAEPRASLGSLLAATQDLSAVSLRPWLLSPIVALGLLVLSYHQVAQALQTREVGRS